MPRPPVGVPVAPWQPAGYLPAPKQARFISEAEQAAEKLPATIKSQSLKNALLKGGAKPLELEYAGMDDFIAQNEGKPVSAADVLAHLKTEGPLGKLKRVEQQVGGKPVESVGWDDEPLMEWEMEDAAGGPVVPPAYAQNIRSPFDTNTASNQTKYHKYTVPGQKGDFSGYREVLLEDPRNFDFAGEGDANRLVPTSEDGAMKLDGPVDAHQSDYWARYNEYDDRIAVQNIQSDVGQEYSKFKRPAITSDNYAAAKDRAAELDLRAQHEGLNNEDMQELRGLDQALAEFEGELPTSPIAKDGNWKNLMARHIALQSINGGGKPITIPTGRQMVDVEGFGMSTHSDGALASKAAGDFNADLVRRLQKIFRGLHPDGADIATHRPSEPLKTSLSSYDAEADRKAMTQSAAWGLEDVLVARGREGADLDRLRESDNLASELLQIATREHERLNTPETLARVTEAIETANQSWNARQMVENPSQARRSGLERSPKRDISIFETLARGGSRQSLEMILKSARPGHISPEVQAAAMRVIQHDRLMQEMGNPGVSDATSSSQTGDLTPGWTIKPSPMAVRQALEKGLPIMSLAPLLLQPSQQENR
jgi:hypothetical protein